MRGNPTESYTGLYLAVTQEKDRTKVDCSPSVGNSTHKAVISNNAVTIVLVQPLLKAEVTTCGQYVVA